MSGQVRSRSRLVSSGQIKITSCLARSVKFMSSQVITVQGQISSGQVSSREGQSQVTLRSYKVSSGRVRSTLGQGM